MSLGFRVNLPEVLKTLTAGISGPSRPVRRVWKISFLTHPVLDHLQQSLVPSELEYESDRVPDRK
jgi:hypothetical protein